MKLEDVILRDTRANQPAATAVPEGSLFYVTDESVTERSNGTTWDDFSDSGSAGTGDVVGPASAVNNNLAVFNGTTGKLIKDGGAPLVAGRLIGVQVITSIGGGTYTPTAGTASIVIELLGAGGGGGGVASPGGTNVGIGQGGSAGAYLRKRLTAAFSGASYSVGTLGNGGAAGNNAGAAGGNTTFTSTVPTTFTAAGGPGGAGDAGSTSPRVRSGLSGGVATNGDINVPGGASQAAIAVSTAAAITGSGGNSHFGAGGRAIGVSATGSTNAGDHATNYGAGGSGAVATTTGAAAAGGNGSNGLIIIWEYA